MQCSSPLTYQLASEDTLKVTGTITKNDKHHILALNTEAMDPTGDLDTLATAFSGLSDLDLFIIIIG